MFLVFIVMAMTSSGLGSPCRLNPQLKSLFNYLSESLKGSYSPMKMGNTEMQGPKEELINYGSSDIWSSPMAFRTNEEFCEVLHYIRAFKDSKGEMEPSTSLGGEMTNLDNVLNPTFDDVS